MSFSAHDEGTLIYHTNIVMFIGTAIAIVCLESIFEDDRSHVIASLETTDHEIMEISLAQLKNMCGNVLEVRNTDGQKKLVMSDHAYHHFTKKQLARIQEHYETIIHPDIKTIEQYGGGSARCMLAEIF
jgi:hypothetical protein